MWKGVIFDLDGVLVDSHPIHKQAWRRFFASLGKRVSDADLDFVLDGRKREDILRHFLGELTDEQIKAYGYHKDELFKEAAGELKIISGLTEFLGLLERTGIHAAVATCANQYRTRKVLHQLGLSTRFTAVVTANDVANGKPDPAIFLLAADRLNLNIDDLLVVEDAVSGVRAAKSAGMRCLGIASGGRAKMLLEAGADHVVPDYTGLALSAVQTLFTSDSS